MAKQIIYISDGAEEYVTVTITERTGEDISSDTIQMSIGSAENPGTWVSPDVDQPQADVSTRVCKLLIGNTFAPSTYYVWVSIGDDPETVVRKADNFTVRLA